MKLGSILTAILALSSVAASSYAATITVNTEDNGDFSPGTTNLVTALRSAKDGDTIAFNIPGGGVKTIATPAGGYDFITNNNLTIDGYTQPGASPNTHGIHEANNAELKIVLDSRNGAGRPMGGPNGTSVLIDTSVWGDVKDSGWGEKEVAILPVYRGVNFTVKGIAFLSSYDSTEPAGGSMKCICFATDVTSESDTAIVKGSASGWHVSGCWFGVDPTTRQVDLSGGVPNSGTIGIATYGCQQALAAKTVYAVNGTVGVAKNSSNPRAEFNVIVSGYGCDLQGTGHRYSGNFANVLPDGLTAVDWHVLANGDQEGDGDFECGGSGVGNLTIGTDGDGVNDADEGNVFAGSTSKGWVNVHMYSGPRTNIVFAGNYVGVGIDGTTRFANNARLIRLNDNAATGRIGSDFDGVSDNLEGNLIYNSYPFDAAYPDPANDSPNYTVRINDSGTRVSFRGNQTVGNGPLPFNYISGSDGQTDLNFAKNSGFFLDASSQNGIIPTLSPANVYPSLSGLFAPGLDPYTNITVDVYQLDPESWANGKLFQNAALQKEDGSYNGFPQGKRYLGTFAVANTGDFTIQTTGLDFGDGQVTVTVNYSADPAGTHNGRVHTSNFSNPVSPIPGGSQSVGLSQIVADTACWFDTALNSVTMGFINPANQPAKASLGNWEPYISRMGDSTFLIEFNTYANDGSFNNQNNAVAKQPADGGPGSVDYAFYGDNKQPFKGQINLSRQNGNPGRVAGDMRYGANTFITEAEASLGQLSDFQTTPRWANNNIYQNTARYTVEQIFNLDPATLVQTPVTNAWDYLYGPFEGVMGASADTTQVGRTGGRPNFLDNGNIVVMADDKSAIVSEVGEVTSFTIITPKGATVKGPTLVDPRNIFDNMCAVKGGFVIRVHQFLYFFDNAGNSTFTNHVNDSSGLNFNGGLDGDRGDGHRIGGDIRSYYVFLAGKIGNGHSCGVAAWDTRTGQFVGGTRVSDGDPDLESTDRTDVAVDALNRVCVTYTYKPDSTYQNQAAARVAQFDGHNFNWLTHSFFPFVNHDSAPGSILGYKTENPVVAMTPRSICFASKATINNENNVAAGPNSLAEQTVYTVVSHPAPVAAPQPTVALKRTGGNIELSWDSDDGLFTVQTRSTVGSGAWVNATAGNVATPVTIPAGSGPLFVRLVR